MKFILEFYSKYFCRRRYYKLNRFLYHLGLRGMGVLNYQSAISSGEYAFMVGLKKMYMRSNLIVFDVGANKGDYSIAIKNEFPLAHIYAFEPHPKTFNELVSASNMYGFKAYNYGLGDKAEQLLLYDHKSDEMQGTQHASIYLEVIEGFHKGNAQQFMVGINTLDKFIEYNKINKIDLLKVDTEGNELNVLKGAEVALRSNIIDIIHFEFNGLNVISRVFMKDFFDILNNYKFYRMLSDGLIPLEYDYLTCEIFAFQNIIAIRNSSEIGGDL